MKLKESKTNIGVYLAIVILFGLLVAGCGAKGKLYLPEEEEAKQQQ
ncbi:LPS translocon maturation chaperone LptM, partial [Kaarinaea lacus]